MYLINILRVSVNNVRDDFLLRNTTLSIEAISRVNLISRNNGLAIFLPKSYQF